MNYEGEMDTKDVAQNRHVYVDLATGDPWNEYAVLVKQTIGQE